MGRYRDPETYRLRRQLLQKLWFIEKHYGAAARAHFVEHPECDRCPEQRLSCLAVHHREGKLVEEFETLCHNCHAVHHGSSLTFEDCSTEGVPERRRQPAACGTNAKYKRGCRCQSCRDAHAAAWLDYQRRRVLRSVS